MTWQVYWTSWSFHHWSYKETFHGGFYYDHCMCVGPFQFKWRNQKEGLN